jgi:hypothetical protein
MSNPIHRPMPRLRYALAALTFAAASLPAAATDVGVSIGVSQPGFYGRIDIGGVAVPPVLVYPQPVVIAPPRAVVVQQPIYLRVPPGHAKHWGKHCARYDACGRPVYFVQEDWYQRYYVDGPGHPRGKGHGHDKRG